MNKKFKLIFLSVLLLAGLGLAALVFLASDAAVLNPKGPIAESERNLLVFTAVLSLLVVIPVFAMTFGIAWKYRAGNNRARYEPDWDHSRVAETVWWAVPALLILVLAGITWQTSHELDPFKPISDSAKPLRIQVVALEWKWLFIYPEQNIATVNLVQFPEDTPLNFEITADAPMNSFWIPQLGGQIYAMAGMKTKLHLMASETGDFRGSSANLSGDGFSGMKFTARASSSADFRRWVNQVKQSPSRLDLTAYDNLAKPTKNQPVSYYASRQADLFDDIMMKYMMPHVR